MQFTFTEIPLFFIFILHNKRLYFVIRKKLGKINRMSIGEYSIEEYFKKITGWARKFVWIIGGWLVVVTGALIYSFIFGNIKDVDNNLVIVILTALTLSVAIITLVIALFLPLSIPFVVEFMRKTKEDIKKANNTADTAKEYVKKILKDSTRDN